jgi:hypothetical protein
MSWDAIGAIGDFLGGLGVIVSLIYLATQVRRSARVTEENTREVGAAAREAVFAGFSRWRGMVLDEKLTSVFVRGCDDISVLDREERFQFGLLMQDFLFADQVLFSRGQDGSSGISPTVAVRNAAGVLSRPGAHEWWSHNKGLFMPLFCDAVTEAIEPAHVEQADRDEDEAEE